MLLNTLTGRPYKSDPAPNVNGAQVCNLGVGSRGWFGGFHSWDGGSSKRCFTVSCFRDPGQRGAADPRPLEWTRTGTSPGTPRLYPDPRSITTWTSVSLVPRNTDRGGGKDPGFWKTWQLFSPATPVTSVSARKAFLPEEGSCRRPPRSVDLRRHPQHRVQGLREHLAFGSETSASSTRVGAGPPGGDRCPAQAFPNGSLGRTGGKNCAVGECACARMRKRDGAWSTRGPARSRRLRPPHLPTSSAWRRRCVRRGLPRVLRAGAAHWSLVLEAAAAAAAAPAAPPPPAVAAAPRARAPAPAPISATPRAPSSPGAAGNMKLRSRRPASE